MTMFDPTHPWDPNLISNLPMCRDAISSTTLGRTGLLKVHLLNVRLVEILFLNDCTKFVTLGRGCRSAGRVVASDYRGPWFELSHW